MFHEAFLFILQGVSNLNLSGNWDLIKYIVSVVIGGVGYKYLKLYFDRQTSSEKLSHQASETLITNLEERIGTLTKRVNDLEDQKQKTHEREIEVTKMLAKAEQKVETLTEKVEMLERNQQVLQDTVDKYYKQYGPLDEIS